MTDMSLAHIVKELGGEMVGRRQAMIPGPGHSASDRSVSLIVRNDGRLVVTSFGRSSWQEVMDDLRRRGFVDGEKRLCSGGSGAGYCTGAEDVSRAAKTRVAQALWAEGQPIAGSRVERHFSLRGIRRAAPGSDVVRYHPAAPLRAFDPKRDRTMPAMLAAIRSPAGEITAVEITFLEASGRRCGRLHLPRKVVGPIPPGSAVRIDPPGPDMVVAEGFFTALSASQRFQLPAWALLSTSRLQTWSPPPEVRRVLIAADNGEGGRRAAALLGKRLQSAGLVTRAEFPPAEFSDFNDMDHLDGRHS